MEVYFIKLSINKIIDNIDFLGYFKTMISPVSRFPEIQNPKKIDYFRHEGGKTNGPGRFITFIFTYISCFF